MDNREELITDGFCYGSAKDAELAREEIKKARFFEQKLNGRGEKDRLAVYDRLLDQKVFKTPAGWEYLKYLRGELLANGMTEEEIRPIPLFISFNRNDKEQMLPKEFISEIELGKNRTSKKQPNSDKLRLSLIINAVLVVLVIAMFVISQTGNSPTILNYKQALINRYSSWEEELKSREKVIRDKEKELGIADYEY